MYVTDSLGTHTYDLSKASFFAISDPQQPIAATRPLDPARKYSILLFYSEADGTTSKTLLGPSTPGIAVNIFETLNMALANEATFVNIRALLEAGLERSALERVETIEDRSTDLEK